MEASDTLTNDNGESRPKRGNKLSQFFKKNKTLTIVLAGGGLYYLLKHGNKESESEAESSGETATEKGEALSAAQGTSELAAFETGRAEHRTENAEEAIDEVEEERQKEREKRRKEKQEEEENKEPSGGGAGEPAQEPKETPPSADSHSVTIHGRTFNGATGSRIARTGETNGGKPYVEYVITFPGENQHWQWFTDTSNWRRVSTPDQSGGKNKAPAGKPVRAQPHPGHGTTPDGGKKQGPTRKKHPSPVAVAPAQPASPPPVATQHPNAVRTANRCVNGGVGGHTAPPGYHLFCGSDGWIYRAPNA